MGNAPIGKSPALLICLVACLACSRQQLGLPRIHLEVESPNGESTALVRNHPDIDPPSPSLWLRFRGGQEVQLVKLAPDLDWCNEIVWSGDGSVVTFLVQDARLVVVDARSARVVSNRWLIDAPRGYPPREIVRGLAVSEEGSVATYRRCPRAGGSCSEPESLEITG